MDHEKPELLDEQIIYRSGSFVRTHRWFRGAHPTLGLITHGWTGVETVQEIDVIVPMRTYTVTEAGQEALPDPR